MVLNRASRSGVRAYISRNQRSASVMALGSTATATRLRQAGGGTGFLDVGVGHHANSLDVPDRPDVRALAVDLDAAALAPAPHAQPHEDATVVELDHLDELGGELVEGGRDHREEGPRPVPATVAGAAHGRAVEHSRRTRSSTGSVWR